MGQITSFCLHEVPTLYTEAEESGDRQGLGNGYLRCMGAENHFKIVMW